MKQIGEHHHYSEFLEKEIKTGKILLNVEFHVDVYVKIKSNSCLQQQKEYLSLSKVMVVLQQIIIDLQTHGESAICMLLFSLKRNCWIHI